MTITQEYLRQLTAERDRAWGEQTAVLERLVRERRSATAEEQAVIDRTDRAIDDIDQRAAQLTERERRNAEAEAAREGLERHLRPEQRAAAGDREEREHRAFMDFIEGRSRELEIDLRPAARELGLFRGGAGAAEYRTILTSTAASAGTLVPTTFAREIYRALETVSGIRKAGPTILTTNGGETFTIPRLASAGTAAIVGEGSAFGTADPTFNTLSLGAWKVAQLVQISREQIDDSGPDIVSFVGNDMGIALARAMNSLFTTGTNSNQPYGVVLAVATLGGTAVTSQTGSTGVPSYENLVDLQHSLGDEAYVEAAVWMSTWANYGKLRKIKDTDGRPLWEPSVIAGQPNMLLGNRIVTNPAMAAFATAANTRSLLFGDFRGFIIREVGTVRLERSDDFAFDKDLVTWRASMRVDSDLRDTGAIKLLAGATT